MFDLTFSDAARRVSKSLAQGRFKPASRNFIRQGSTKGSVRFDVLGRIAKLTGLSNGDIRRFVDVTDFAEATGLDSSLFKPLLGKIANLNEVFVRNAHRNPNARPSRILVGELMHLANKYDKYVKGGYDL